MPIRTRPASQTTPTAAVTAPKPPRVSDETASVMSPKAFQALTAFVEKNVHPDIRVSVTTSQDRGQLELHLSAVNKRGEVLLSARQKFPDVQPAFAHRDPEFGSRPFAFGALDQMMAFSEGYRSDPQGLANRFLKSGESVGQVFNGQAMEVTGGTLYRKALEAPRGWRP